MITSSYLDKRRYNRYFVDLRNLYQRKEIVVYTGLTLSLFALAFFGIFALRPTFITIAGLVKEIQDKKIVEQKLQTKINNLRQAQGNYAQVAGSVSIVNQALPPNPSLSELIYQIEVLAQKSNLTINSINFSPVDLQGKSKTQKASTKLTGVSDIRFDLSVKGDFEGLKNFLESLGKSRRLVMIDSFAISKGKVEETALVFIISSRSFYSPKE